MKRLVLAFAAFGFVAFIGAQSAHAHQGAVRDDCQFCVLCAQAVRHMPTVVAAPVPVRVSLPLAEKLCAKPQVAHSREASARGPPDA